MDESHGSIVRGIEAICSTIFREELDVAFDLDDARHEY